MARARRKKQVVKPTRVTWLVLGLAVCGGLVAARFLIWPPASGPPLLALPGCHTGATVPGIDVSYYQETIAWPRVRRAGIRFAFVRVSDGLTFRDSRFVRNWREARDVGILRGAYQFFRPEQDALAQADLMIAALERDPGELPPVIDVEDSGGQAPMVIAARVRVWTDRVRGRLGVEPIVYTGPDFWRTRVDSADLTRQPLWLAHYTRECPQVPAPWRSWAFWQHSDTGRVPGIKGKVDLNVFAGTLAELQAFAQRSRLAGTR
jgi:lysozyme